MKIGINAFGCKHGRSGIGAYVYSLVNNLPEIEHEVSIFGPELDRYTYTSDIDYVAYEGISIDDTEFAEKLWHKTHFNAFVQKTKYDAVLFPAGTGLLPIANFSKPVFLVIQEPIEPEKKSLFGFFSKFSNKMIFEKATGIIAPTKYIKKSLIEAGIPKNKIKVIHNGINTDIFHPRKINENEVALMEPFAIRRPYIIYASRISEPEKHHVELIRGFSIFKQKTNAPHRLVIAGAEGENADIVYNEVMDSPVSSDILLTGYIEHEKLANLYVASDLCIFPSTIEGVGLPVIEAMACGIPTACANAGALPEIAGYASHFFDPENPEAISAAIMELATFSDGSTDDYRQKMTEKGLEWVKKYNWTKTSIQTFDYITDLLSNL
ncbi:MAG: glycosyl transferase family 1 [Treponema sp.]|nr:MAG: glycosyl transferase family 1 [Treponema sp.]